MTTKETKYLLVLWPESQKYIEKEGVFLCGDVEKVGCAAYFVPEEMIEELK